MSSKTKPKSYSALARQRGKRFLHSIWFFPAVLFVIVCLFTAFKISGTSAGAYRQILYGPTVKDSALLLGKPESIRSDEWLVVTQMTIAQSKSGYPRINHNIGNGEDMSVMPDVPYKEWSIIFRPRDLAFFVMPLANAFAFKWWIMGFLLVVSCYSFILTLLPGKKALAIGLSSALFFSAYVQWWYVYTTLDSLYFSFFIATAAIQLFRQRVFWRKIAWGALLAYLIVCFTLILYPPFQIGCGLVVLVFLIGYFLENYSAWGKRQAIRNLLFAGASCLLAIVIVLIFILTRLSVVKTIENTAYPGTRSISSGGVSIDHFLASHLGHQFLSIDATTQYLINDKVSSNQSETANFLLLTPFLLLPSLWLVYRERKRRQPLDWPLLLINLLFLVYLLEFFVPGFTTISKIFLLNKVGGPRLLLGMGLLNMVSIILFIRNLAKKKSNGFSIKFTGLYCLVVLAIELFISLHAHYKFGTFIGLKHAILFSLPLPLVVYLLLKKRFVPAAVIYLVFSVFISIGVNPLYRGLGELTNGPLDAAVKSVAGNSHKRWISDGGYLENIGSINGEPALSGVYNYPQLSLWKNIPGAKISDYNRYAHVAFQVSDDPATPTSLTLSSADSIYIRTSDCSSYLRQMNVGFMVSSAVLKSSCVTLQKTVALPAITLYVYSFN